MGRRYIIFYFSIIFFNFIIYASGLRGDFVWDDRSLILQNPFIEKSGSIWEVFGYPLKIFGEEHNYYRPLSIISFIFDHRLWGKNAFGFHLTNLLLHIIVVLLLFQLCHQLFGFTKAILISILYSTFAVHVENVVFISGRMDILATLFMLLSLIIYFSEKKLPLFLRLLSCYLGAFLALLTKEISFVLGLIFLLVVFFKVPRAQWKKHFLFGLISIGGATISYLILRELAVKPVPEPLAGTTPLLLRIFNLPRLILFYLQLSLLPYNLNARHYEFVMNSGKIDVIIICAFIIGIMIFLITRIKKPEITMGSLWFIFGLLPVMNLFPLPGIPVAERFLYLPSAGIAILLIGLIPNTQTIKKNSSTKDLLIKIVLLFIALFNIFSTIKRVPVWHDEEIFFKTMVAQNPKAPLAHHNLGYYYYRKGDWDKAEMEFKKAIALNPYFPAPHASLGDIYTQTGRYQEAIKEYSIYLRLYPNAPNRTATITRIKGLEDLLSRE